jgi:hypothetical protein
LTHQAGTSLASSQFSPAERALAVHAAALAPSNFDVQARLFASVAALQTQQQSEKSPLPVVSPTEFMLRLTGIDFQDMHIGAKSAPQLKDLQAKMAKSAKAVHSMKQLVKAAAADGSKSRHKSTEKCPSCKQLLARHNDQACKLSQSAAAKVPVCC